MLKIPVRPSLEVEAVRWDGREMFSVRSPASTGFFQRQSQSVCFEIYIQRTVVAASKVNNVASGLLCGRLLCSEPLMIAAAAKRKDSWERKAVNSPVNMTRIFSKVSQFFKVWWNHIHVANLNREQTLIKTLFVLFFFPFMDQKTKEVVYLEWNSHAPSRHDQPWEHNV